MKYLKKSPPTGSQAIQTIDIYAPLDQEETKRLNVSTALQDNVDFLQKQLGASGDIIFRRFYLGIPGNYEACLIYIDGASDKILLNSILKSLMLDAFIDNLPSPRDSLQEIILGSLLTAASTRTTQRINELIDYIMAGQVVLLVDKLNEAIAIDIRSLPQRAISEPPSEVTVRGPRTGFTEVLQTNVTLLRDLIHSPNLVFEFMKLGQVSGTDVSLVYIKGIAAPELIQEVNQRLAKIDIDAILAAGYIEELIEDSPYSPFPQMINTERPDRVAANLLEGRIAILINGCPFALVLPVQLTSFLTAPEDYYERALLATATRWIRYIAFTMSLLLPSTYIAITTFHQEMIPLQLLNSIAAYRQGVPLPTLVEALLMEFIFEVLREAGIRLPRAVGQTVSIAGAIVIGQSGVQAGIVSPLMVIIVATTGIASFTIPAYSMGISLRLLRFPLMILAGTMGLYGVIIGLVIMTIHAMKLSSFGVPFAASLSPLHLKDWKDVFIRVPWWAMDERPAEISAINRRRQAPGMKPAPPGNIPELNGGKS